MVRIYDLWGKHRHHFLFEIFLYKLLLLLFQFFEIKTADTIRTQLLLDLCICLVTFLVKWGNCTVNCIQLLLWCHAGPLIDLLAVRCHHIIQASYTDHKKLV